MTEKEKLLNLKKRLTQYNDWENTYRRDSFSKVRVEDKVKLYDQMYQLAMKLRPELFKKPQNESQLLKNNHLRHLIDMSKQLRHIDDLRRKSNG